MSAAEFWEQDPYLVIAYRDADMRTRQRQNNFLWLQGLYVYDAMSATLHNAFSKKGSKPMHYTKEPYRITPMTEEEKEEAARKEREKAIRSFNNWKSAWDRQNG